MIHVWKHQPYQLYSACWTTWRWTDSICFSMYKKRKKKYKEFLLFNFIYFFLDYFSRSVLFLRSLETNCRWHKFVCVYTENSFYNSKNQTRLLLIRTHLINFSIFYNLLSISIRRHSIREYVFGFWFFGFFHNRLFFFLLENCRLTIFQFDSFLRFERYRHKNRKQIVQTNNLK